MSTSAREKLKAQVEQFYHTPSGIQKVALDYLEEMMDGKIDLVDPSNPFMFLLEASATNTHAAIVKTETVAREQYPLLARTYEDLYHHMSDVDYLDRFASPSRTRFNLVIPVDTLNREAVTDTLTGLKRLRIPKDTTFTVGGLSWYIHRPIEVTLTASGVIQVYYNLSVSTPLVDESTNLLSFYTVKTQDKDWLVISIPAEQLAVSHSTHPVSSSTGFNVTLSYTDQFYALRAYRQVSASDPWEEIRVTHSDQVYDREQMTLRAKVAEGVVKVTLPEIYQSGGKLAENILLILYTTKGAIQVDLSDYTSESYDGKFLDLTNPLDPYIQPISNMNDLQIYNEEAVVGGRDALSFEDLRNRVIYRSADQRASITFAELGFQLEDMGYAVTKAKDNITERQYICSKLLPPPTTANVYSSIGVRHAVVYFDTHRSDLTYFYRDNGLRKTLSQVGLYRESGGAVSFVTDSEFNALKGLSNDALAVELNNTPYYYSPFVHVFDSNRDLYLTRTYYLDKPTVKSRNFYDSNNDLPFAISTQEITVQRLGDRFIVRIVAAVPPGVKGVYAQIQYRDPSNRRYVKTVTGSEIGIGFQEFTITLESTLDITEENRIEITNLIGGSNTEESAFLELVSEFELFYLYQNKTAPKSLFESKLYRIDLDDVVGVTYEQFTLVFGEELTKLFMRSRATIVPPAYQTYAEDVYQRYEKDVYERDENGLFVYTVDENTNKPVFNKLHSAGDIILDENEQPILKHAKGDVIVDSDGNPVIREEERLIWEFTPLLLDAKYYFATATGAVEYRESVPEVVIDSLSRDIVPMADKVMARTDLVFQPTASTGVVRVNMDSDVDVLMDTALRFKVTYVLVPAAYTDSAIRSRLSASTRDVIIETVSQPVFSKSELIRRLKENGGEYVVDVSINDVLNGYNVGVLLPENTNFSVFSELVPLSNGRLDVQDAIDVTFIRKIEE
jgi:hypothetical protein